AHGKQRRQVVRSDRLVRTRVQRRRHRLGQIGCNVVPGFGNAVLRQIVLDGFHARNSTSENAWVAVTGLGSVVSRARASPSVNESSDNIGLRIMPRLADIEGIAR